MLCKQCGQPIPQKKCIPPLFNKRGFITHNHPIRGEVCHLSSGPYYHMLGDFCYKLYQVLGRYGLSVDLESLGQSPRKDGNTYEVFPLITPMVLEEREYGQDIVITTYKMESGRWEVCTHLT